MVISEITTKEDYGFSVTELIYYPEINHFEICRTYYDINNQEVDSDDAIMLNDRELSVMLEGFKSFLRKPRKTEIKEIN